MGNPGVSQVDPYPYPSDPTLSLAGRGFVGRGQGFYWHKYYVTYRYDLLKSLTLIN